MRAESTGGALVVQAVLGAESRATASAGRRCDAGVVRVTTRSWADAHGVGATGSDQCIRCGVITIIANCLGERGVIATTGICVSERGVIATTGS